MIVLCFTFPTALACARELWFHGPGFITQLFGLILVIDFVAGTSYTYRWPERWFPGKFDYVGSGHQIMHVMVVLEYMLQFRLMYYLAQQALLMSAPQTIL